MSDIEEVKNRTNIVDVIGSRIPLKKAGRHFKALCPFHSEKTPSFIISPERQTWKCFGCGKGGSVIDFVMEYDHMDFVEALTDLAEKAGVKLERRLPETPEGKIKQKIYEANHLASEYYHYLLTKHALGEKARIYLKSRGISDKSIKTFLLGYSPNGWEGLSKYLQKKGYERRLLEQAGLLIASPRGGYDRFRGRIMFTLKDHRGNIVGFSGRVLDPDIKEAKYINTSETPVYSKSNVLFGLDVTKEAIVKANEAILTEGEFDVISSFQAGIGNVVAIKGSALTEGHVALLKRFSERLVFALDSDLAGDAAARRGIAIADKAGLDIRVVTMPSGKDPDEAARENAGMFKKAIQEALPVYDYFLESAMKRFDKTTAFGKKKISEELLPTLADIDNPIVQSHYAKALADALDVSDDVIAAGIKKTTRNKRQDIVSSGRQLQEGDGLSRLEKLELFTVALLLQGKNTQETFEELVGVVSISELTNPALRLVLEKLEVFLGKQRVFLIKDFADSLPKELLPTFDSAFLWDIADIVEDEVRYAKEWDKTLKLLEEGIIRNKIYILSKSLKDPATQGEDAQKLHETLSVLTKKLTHLEKSS